MSSGKFVASINEAAKLLKELNLLKNDTAFHRGKISDEFKKVSQGVDYKLIYDTAVNHADYDLLLMDDSIFQFEEDSNHDMRFAFIQSPYVYMSFVDFLYSTFGEDECFKNKSQVEALKATYENEYEQALSELGINNRAVYFRYDVDSIRYTPNIHSFAHLHIGIDNDIRIPFRTILSPVSFVIFVIKHTYKAVWEEAIKDNTRRKVILKLANDKTMLDVKYMSTEEQMEISML